MAADGHAYERTAIERWLATKSTSPMTGEELGNTSLFPNHILRRMIREWREARPAALLLPSCVFLSSSTSLKRLMTLSGLCQVSIRTGSSS